jgi:FMN reductase
VTDRRIHRITAVVAGLRQPSSTRLLADRLVEATAGPLRAGGEDVDVTVLELRDLAHDITDHMLTGFPSPRLEVALDAVAGADGLVVVSPVFSASYSGLFKSFFDVLGPDTLDGKPVLVGATGGTARHSLALEYALRPLFAYHRAAVAPTAVFAASEDFGAAGGSASLSARVDRAGAELASLVRTRPVEQPLDPFEEPTPFAELLGG